jgi:DnaJ-class molecular chaperone
MVQFQTTQPCRACAGAGRIIVDPCVKCCGAGIVVKKDRYDVTVNCQKRD